MNAAAIPLARHKLTVIDYHRMVEVGILAADAQMELVEGEIFDMAPIGSRHNSAVNKLNRLLGHVLQDQAILQVHGSLRINSYTELQPDIVLLKHRSDFYENEIPGPDHTLLLIEVADSTLAYDRGVKTSLYASSGIPEYWLIDLEHRQVIFHRHPIENRYREIQTVKNAGLTQVASLEGVLVDLSSLS